MKPIRPIALAAVGLGLAWGPGAGALSAQETLEIHRAVPADAYLKVWGGGGTVEIRGWEHDSLAVTGRIRSGPGRFFHRVEGGVGKLGLEVDPKRAGEVDAVISVKLPATSTVWVKVAGAHVDARGLTGTLDVHAVSGSVQVTGSPEALTVESMAGELSLDLDAAGVVRAKGGEADVRVAGDVLDLTATAVGGDVLVDLDSARRAELETIDGRIAWRGGLERGGWLSARTHSADVELVLPAGLGPELDLATVEGEIESEIGATPATGGAFPGVRLVDEAGAGSATVEVRTFSGTIRVRRGR